MIIYFFLTFFLLSTLTSLVFMGKYNYSLLDRVLLEKVNSLGNKFYILVEVIRTYKTFTCCFILSTFFLNFLRDRKICVMLHFVNYSYIALSLGVKVRRKIMKFAGYGATSLLGQPNNKAYSNTALMYHKSVKLEKDMLVEFKFISSRATATFKQGVVVDVMKRDYNKVLQRSYSNCKEVKRDLSFINEWKLLESNIIKDIKKGHWPKLTIKANKLLKQLQTKICHLSSTGTDTTAMKLIEKYSMNIVIRYIAINKVTAQSGLTPGVDNFIIKNSSHKIELLSQSKQTKLNSLPTMKVKLVEIPKPNGSSRILGISTILDRVLQTQLYLLLDPFKHKVT